MYRFMAKNIIIHMYSYKKKIMAFRYRLQKVLEFRIRKKEEQLQNVIKAKNEVERIQGLIDSNNQEIAGVIKIMRSTHDYRMMDAYDKYLKHLYEKGEELELLSPKNNNAKVKILEIHDENGEIDDCKVVQQRVRIKTNIDLEKNEILRRKK